MAETPDTFERIHASFARQTMMKTLGAQLLDVTAGKVVIGSDIAPHILQQHGFAHAGVAFSIGDSAAGYAALSQMPDGAEVLTAEMKINLLAPAQGQRLEATGRVIKSGKRLVVVSATVVAIDSDIRRDIAVLQGTMVPHFPKNHAG